MPGLTVVDLDGPMARVTYVDMDEEVWRTGHRLTRSTALRPGSSREISPAGRTPGTCVDAFVSYSRRDAGLMLPIVQAAEPRGRSFWFDADDIPGRAAWRRSGPRRSRPRTRSSPGL